ncbi:hypothetical protein HLV35_03130 [Eggerthellaceae bacterium zg-997]|nr:hypothetical protein [Eggerthellaceae bacterium zg-997]
MEPSLIITSRDGADLRAVDDFELDMEIGDARNDFELRVRGRLLRGGEIVAIEGTEYGGTVDRVTHDSRGGACVAEGRTWHGILATRILCPPPGQSHLIARGDANAALAELMGRLGLDGVMSARRTASGVSVEGYRFARFTDAYTGIRSMLAASGAKLRISRDQGRTELWAEPVRAVSGEADSDAMSFTATENARCVNHLVCMGEGEMEERAVLHLYADAQGNVSSRQSLFGLDEVCMTYDYSGADADKLREDGAKKLRELQSQGAISATVADMTGDAWGVGDVIEAVDHRSGRTVAATVAAVVVKVERGRLSASFKVGDKAEAKAGGIAAKSEAASAPVWTAGSGISISAGRISAEVSAADLAAVRDAARAASASASNASAAAGRAQRAADESVADIRAGAGVSVSRSGRSVTVSATGGAAFLSSYPVGSVYMTTRADDRPASRGGTWARLTPVGGCFTWQRES